MIKEISKWYIVESESESRSVLSNSLWAHGLYSPLNSPGQNTGVGSLSFLQGIFPTQGSYPGLPHYGQILYQLSHKGSSRILEWVVYPFSRLFSWPRDQIGISCIAGGFFTKWAMREAQMICRVVKEGFIQKRPEWKLSRPVRRSWVLS